MDEVTALDRAHAAMMAQGEADAARMRFYEQLTGSELVLLLQHEARGDAITPRCLTLDEGIFALVFDRESRAADFAAGPAAYAAMPGRALCDLLAGAGLGLALNPGVAPSSFLLPPKGVVWLAETLRDHVPAEVAQRIARVFAPKGLPEDLVAALDARLATAAGLADAAYLVGVEYDTGARGHLLGIIDARAGAEVVLARAIGEVLGFSGLEAAVLDVAFFGAGDPVAARLERTGLRFDLPRPQEVDRSRSAPGTDPETPPILR